MVKEISEAYPAVPVKSVELTHEAEAGAEESSTAEG